MSWRTAPLVRPLLFLILGVLLGSYFSVIPFLYLIVLGFTLLFILLAFQNRLLAYRFKKYFGGFISICFIFVGFILSSSKNPELNPNHAIHLEQDQITAIATVAAAPSVKNKVLVSLQLETHLEGEESKKLLGGINAFFPIDNESQDLVTGDKVLVKAKLNSISKTINPYSFDFKKYYARKGIYHQAQISEWQLIKKGNPIRRTIAKQRAKLLYILSEHLPTENEFAVGAALCLGSKSALSDELKNEYASTGAMHVLAISGLHVGIIFTFLLFIFGKFKTRKTLWLVLKILCTISLLWIYALFTGGSPSVLRAALMFSFVTIAVYIRSNSSTYNTLSSAAICLLIYDPALLFDVGFQLSFTAVAGIVYFQPRIYAWLYFENKIFDYLWQISAVGIAAQLATFPIGLYYFHHLPPLFLLTGLFVVPFAWIILVVSIVFFIAHSFSSLLATWIGKILYGLIWINNSLIHFLSDAGSGLDHYIFIGTVSMIGLYAILFFFDHYFKTGKLTAIWMALSLVLLLSVYNIGNRMISAENGYLCVYQIPNESLIDLGFKQELLSYTTLSSDHKKLQYTSENLRKYRGIKQDENKSHTSRSIDPINLVGEKRVAIIKEDPNFNQKVDVDYVILNSESIDLNTVLAAFDFTELVIDGNISNKVRDQWVAVLKEKDYAFHDIKTDGAFYRSF